VIHDPGHALVESVAAAVLVAGGAIALLLAGRARLAGGSVALLSEPPAAVGPAGGLAVSAVLAAALSLGAAVIHFAAAPVHVEELGPLGLGFVAAGAFQAAWALASLIEPARGVVFLGMAGNLTILVAWAWSRSVGLPGMPVEPITAPDAVTSLFEGLLVILLATRSRLRPTGPVAIIALVPAVGLVFLGTILALSSPALGHGH
jgi:hypothetical protein